MTKPLKIVMAQLNFLVGDIEGNTQKIITKLQQARDELDADLVVFPELAITGYPPEDLLFRKGFYTRVNDAVANLKKAVTGIEVIVGYPWRDEEGQCYNSVAHLREHEIVTHVYKHYLPNYGVFDEMRYFKAGTEVGLSSIHGMPIALSVCEDMWYESVMAQAKAAGAKLMISINASPFDMNKPFIRQEIMSQRAIEGGMPLIYVNTVGGQDELVFDGGSMAISADGNVHHLAPLFVETLEPVLIADGKIISEQLSPPMSDEARIYEALVLGVRDYILKNGFKGAVIGLSGGIDSALTIAIAVDAIGAENVSGFSMPSRYTAKLSVDAAREESEILGTSYRVIDIEPMYQAFLNSIQQTFPDRPANVTEENLQARVRGTLLMAVSNKTGAIVLSTGNKSELAVGYATLYGDMVGGFCMLKDIPKTWVYRLCHYRNSISYVIPQVVIDRRPTAELAANQFDDDTLPPYPILDAILELYIEKDASLEDIIAAGFDKETALKVIRMVEHNEYKRRQSPVGVRVTAKAFGRDRRYPITSGYNKYYEGEPS